MPSTWKRLFGPAQISNAAATKYTVPALTKTRIRHIHISNPSGSIVNLTISIGADAAGVRIFDAFPIPANDVYNDYGVYVVDAAEIIQAFGSTTNILVLTIDGEEITLG